MIRSAVLVSGKGTKLQSLLDSVFFGEIPELQLVAVISSDAGAYALKRARNAGIETVVVEPSVFPNDTSYDMAIRNKLKDMDIELVINAGFYPGIGRETAKSFRGKVIAVQPSLVPAFETLRGDAVHEAVLARGLKVTGATAYLADENGGIGPVLLQKAVPVLADDDLTTLKRRVLTDAEWKLLPEAVKCFCGRPGCTAAARRSWSEQEINEIKSSPEPCRFGAVSLFKNLAAFAPAGAKNVRSFSRAACASKRMLQPAMMCTRMTPSADLSAAMNSSIVVCMFSVAAVIVTGATPLVGMLWLMVSIFAPFSAKIARTDDSTPCRSSSSRLNVTRWPRDMS